MSIKRFNPTCAGVRVWYIMSLVGTRGLTWALGRRSQCNASKQHSSSLVIVVLNSFG